jgi:hypothetical protein
MDFRLLFKASATIEILTGLAILGTTGRMNGVLLWPVAVLHGLIGAAMLWVISSRARINKYF